MNFSLRYRGLDLTYYTQADTNLIIEAMLGKTKYPLASDIETRAIYSHMEGNDAKTDVPVLRGNSQA